MTFWQGKRVLLTGHTGFKGAWAGRWLARLGAEVTGVGLPAEAGPSLFAMLGTAHLAASHLVDLRDRGQVDHVVAHAQPDLVLHMAAQPLVRLSYADPVATFASNVMGTVHLLDGLRRLARPQAILVVTSDKVYENDGLGRAFTEDDRLGGHDPYSASKAAAEIVVSSYRRAFFAEMGVPLVVARGGNVIGGGDYSADRLVPDIVRAIGAGETVVLRTPAATRPWQHVLDCLDGYICYLRAVAEGQALPEALNFGPPAGTPAITVAALTDGLLTAMGEAPAYDLHGLTGPHEMAVLSIDPSRAAQTLGWQPRLTAPDVLRLTADWYAAQRRGADIAAVTDRQIDHYQDLRADLTPAT